MSGEGVIAQLRDIFAEEFEDTYGEDYSIYKSDLEKRVVAVVRAHQQELQNLLEEYKSFKQKVLADVSLSDSEALAGAYCNCARWLEVRLEKLGGVEP